MEAFSESRQRRRHATVTEIRAVTQRLAISDAHRQVLPWQALRDLVSCRRVGLMTSATKLLRQKAAFTTRTDALHSSPGRWEQQSGVGVFQNRVGGNHRLRSATLVYSKLFSHGYHVKNMTSSAHLTRGRAGRVGRAQMPPPHWNYADVAPSATS